MGVKTPLSLQEAQTLFPNYSLTNLQATTNGVIDTTYVTEKYVLKKYERSIEKRIEEDAKRLEFFSKHQLHVPKLLAKSKEWYLYERLLGESPKSIRYYHIQALARFMAQLHTLTKTQRNSSAFLAQYNIDEYLSFLKKDFFFYYKFLEPLKAFKLPCDGFIHGDIFKDNTLFYREKIAVFDFIDGGCGAFSFDVAVALMAFNPYNKSSFRTLFLQTYNQHSKKKLTHTELQRSLHIATKLYMLLRIHKTKQAQNAKKLLKPYIK
ncbi:phosphotransferase [Sulfurimonas sp.]|uniref:phosphotransferase n=1 Tax=Sulfurimonas sp. TaxID=2022749 RepID=UPI002636E741|nr:phosphotransferase [Sulfurimonas sp.]